MSPFLFTIAASAIVSTLDVPTHATRQRVDAQCGRKMFARSISEPRDMQTAVVVLIALLGIALSIKSIIVLGGVAPWTSAGWWLTVLYFIAVIAKATVTSALPVYAEYAVLVALTGVFVLAGVRDERQAEPWWWPNDRGATRAEKRRPT